MATAIRLRIFGTGVRKRFSTQALNVRCLQGATPWQNQSIRIFPAWRYFSTQGTSDTQTANKDNNAIRISKLLSEHAKHLAISRREAERLIKGGDVTVAGQVITSPYYLLHWDDLTNAPAGVIKVSGKAVALTSPEDKKQAGNTPKIWIVHKLKGEVVSDFDPQGRPSLMQRLMHGGVGKKGKKRLHIKSIGRLDMMSEGLILVTSCGRYAREMELPAHQLHRTYKVRAHGVLTRYKIQAIQRGIKVEKDGITTRYGPMKVHMEAPKGRRRSSTNTWIQISCTEGKNRQIRQVLQHLGLTVTRLIRTSFGDYNLDTIPPGMAIEVPIKAVDKQKRKGPLFPKKKRAAARARTAQQVKDGEAAVPVQWVRHYR